MTVILSVLPEKMFLKIMAGGEITGGAEVQAAASRYFFIKKNANYIRMDLLAIILLYAGAFMIYGKNYGILLAFIICRSLLISFMDNIYHYGTKADNSQAGKNLVLPKLTERLFLNSNYHGTHHYNPQIAWCYLPKIHKEQGRDYDGKFFKEGFKQFKGQY